MELTSLSAIETLRAALAEDPRVLALSEAEANLNSDPEVPLLKVTVQQAEERYEEVLRHYDESSSEAKEALHELFLAKKALDELPVCREYNKCFGEVRRLYEEIDARVLGPFRSIPRCKGGQR